VAGSTLNLRIYPGNGRNEYYSVVSDIILHFSPLFGSPDYYCSGSSGSSGDRCGLGGNEKQFKLRISRGSVSLKDSVVHNMVNARMVNSVRTGS